VPAAGYPTGGGRLTAPAPELHHPRKILLTGGAGFIGSNLVHHLLAKHADVSVVTLDALTYAGDQSHLDDLPDARRHTLVVGDIADRALVDRLLRDHAIDTVLHLAAESHVDRSITGPAAFIQSNVVGTYVLLEAARVWWLEERGASEGSRRFHHVSTDEVYGDLDAGDAPFDVSTPYRPSSPYSASKAASDHLVRAWARTYGLPVTLSNCSNNFGPRQHDEKLIPVVIRSCVGRRPIPVYGRGENVRDWLHVDDHCAALDAIVRRGTDGETYLVGADNEWRNLDLVRLICRLVAEAEGVDPHETLRLVTFVTDRPGHDRRYAVDGTTTRALGWAPAHSFEEDLRATVAWYLRRFGTGR
jgi:dTDP-glucose 4,6-dehydratase